VVSLLQVEVETVREEVTFKDHRICEMEQAVLKEKERFTALEGEVQVCECIWERVPCTKKLSISSSPSSSFYSSFSSSSCLPSSSTSSPSSSSTFFS